MKTIIISLMLACAGITGKICAQQTISYVPLNYSRTDWVFHGPVVGSSNIKFDFQLQGGNKMMLEFNSLKQVDSLPELNSLLKQVWKDLQFFRDSLSVPLVNRRVDYITSSLDNKIRIIQYPQKGSVYSIKNDEVTQLKVEQDTLRIRLYTLSAINSRSVVTPHAYYITFLLNNITDFEGIVSLDKLNPAIALLKNDLAVKSNQRKRVGDVYYALYNVESGKRIRPAKLPILNASDQKAVFVPPYVQLGVQYLRGQWTPSVGVGLELQKRTSTERVQHYRLIWEPYFVFSRDPSSKLMMDRNDFISFKYSLSSKITTPSRQIEFLQTVSIGYLVNNSGEWFEPHTIKFSLPGFHSKNILLEPEFVFNDFFKNFSPSLKLVLYFE